MTVRYVNFYQMKLKYIVSVIEYFESTKVRSVVSVVRDVTF